MHTVGLMWAGDASPEQSQAQIDDYLASLWRNRFGLTIWLVLCLVGAFIYKAETKPEFIAVAQIVLQPKITAQDGPEALRAFRQLALDGLQAQTEQQIILSNRVLSYVFDKLQLTATGELSSGDDSWLTRALRRWHGRPDIENPNIMRVQAFDRFRKRVRSRRLALSYVVEVSYQAQDPAQAARVANAVVSAYVRDRLQKALADAQVMTAYHTSQLDALEAEERAASKAVAAGRLPDGDTHDSNVRLLGPAVPPLTSQYPLAAPLIGLALCLGLVAALLFQAIRASADQRIRSGRHLADRLGILCIASVPRSGRRHAAESGPLSADLRAGLHRVWAVVAARRDETSVAIGFVSWAEGAGTRALAGGLSDIMTAAGRAVSLVDLDAGRAGSPIADPDHPHDAPPAHKSADPEGRLPSTVIATVPPLRKSLEAAAMLPGLDVAVLVVEAYATTIGEARDALRILRSAKIPVAGFVINKARRSKASSRHAPEAAL